MSKIQIGPYINFQGRAREAMAFYHKVLGGNLDLHPTARGRSRSPLAAIHPHGDGRGHEQNDGRRRQDPRHVRARGPSVHEAT